MDKKLSHHVKEVSPSTRLVDYIGPIFSQLGSKSAAKKALKKKAVFLNGNIAYGHEFLNRGDRLELRADLHTRIKKLDVDIPIIYEDEFLIVVNKPAGIATNGNRHKTAENAVIGRYNMSSAEDALYRPISVHRLDVPTRGLLIMAKTKTALRLLGQLFQQKRVHKHYYAIVHGKPAESGIVDKPIQGKSARTEFETVRVVKSRIFDTLSLVRLKPHTGRTHQLRIHMSSLGHLIAGDKQYADGQKTILGKGVYLAACGLAFKHPITNRYLELTTDIPNKFLRLLDREEARF